jgi:hypothetical protein
VRLIRIKWRSKITGFVGFGEWIEDTTANRLQLQRAIDDAASKHPEIVHWIEEAQS